MSAAEISANTPLPVFVTNGSPSSILPIIFAENMSLIAIGFVGGFQVDVQIHKVQGEWILCDFSSVGSNSAKDVWVNVPALTGFTWKLKLDQ